MMKSIRNERGITVIEAVVTGAIMAVILFFAFRQLSGIQSRQSDLAQRLRMRELIEMELSKLKGMASAFPPLVDAAGGAFSYVRCFARTGSPSANSSGSMNYSVLKVAPTPVPTPSGICSGSEMEVQILPDKDAPGHASINAFVLLGGVKAKTSYYVPVSFEPAI